MFTKEDYVSLEVAKLLKEKGYNEVWKDIKGYEGLYQVSNFGRVKSLRRSAVLGKNIRQVKEKVIKPFITNKGYYQIFLSKNGKTSHKCVHRLVAMAFIPNPNEYLIINHKDENPLNNCVDNLEWCDYSYNNNYGNRNKIVSDKMTNGKLSKKVLQLTLNGDFVKEYPSTKQVERELGFYHSHISKCCLGTRDSAYGYKWKFK